jgi:hypothetical protein
MIPPAKTQMGSVLRAHGSDKAWPHCFDVFYSTLFTDRNAALDILEIGLADGQSVCAWRDYFPNARIMGFDVEPCERLSGERIECHQVEQTDLCGMWQFIGSRRFDWIVEDAAHLMPKQILTMVYLWQALKPGAYYCLEDVAGCDYKGYSYPAALACFKGEYHDLATPEYPDGGHLFVMRRPT